MAVTASKQKVNVKVKKILECQKILSKDIKTLKE